jgi:hypothetical protein
LRNLPETSYCDHGSGAGDEGRGIALPVSKGQTGKEEIDEFPVQSFQFPLGCFNWKLGTHKAPGKA